MFDKRFAMLCLQSLPLAMYLLQDSGPPHDVQMLDAMRKALKPAGRIVLVEFRAEDPQVPIKPEHKMSKEQILKELPPNGFKLVQEFDGLPWQHVMWFEKDETK